MLTRNFQKLKGIIEEYSNNLTYGIKNKDIKIYLLCLKKKKKYLKYIFNYAVCLTNYFKNNLYDISMK